MPFVQGKCENCGGILTVDPNLKAANCPFCGVAYVVQDSINNYNTTIKVDTMHADIVNVSDESTAEGRIRAGDALMKLGRYDKALSEYKTAIDLTPQNYKGWLGWLEAYTQKYTVRIRSSSELNRINEYAKSIKIVAPDNSSEKILNDYYKYVNQQNLLNNNEINAVKDAIRKQSDIWYSINTQQTELSAEYTSTQTLLQQKIDKSGITGRSKLAIFLIGFAVLFLFIGAISLGKQLLTGILSFVISSVLLSLMIITLVKRNNCLQYRH